MIALSELSFGYAKTARPLFNKLNMELPAGTLCGMLGPNGAGKSTLLKILAGLIHPASGQCQVLSHSPSDRCVDFLSDVFLLPEDIYVPPISFASFHSRYSPFYPKFNDKVFTNLLQEFNIPDGKSLRQMSLGQKKKFLLAFGIATQTRLLIMDEPTNGLDIPSKAQFRKVLVNHFDSQRSFIISTHQVQDLEGLIDSLIVVSDGKILLQEDLDFIGSRIAMTKEKSVPDDALYYEDSLHGFSVVRKNLDGIEGHVDLELLYGFVTSDSSQCQEVFGRGAEA